MTSFWIFEGRVRVVSRQAWGRTLCCKWGRTRGEVETQSSGAGTKHAQSVGPAFDHLHVPRVHDLLDVHDGGGDGGDGVRMQNLINESGFLLTEKRFVMMATFPAEK